MSSATDTSSSRRAQIASVEQPAGAQHSQQLLLAAEKPFAQKGQPERLEASGGFARKRFGKGPAGVDRRLDLCCGTVVAETHAHSADAVDAQQRVANIFRHQIGEIHRAPAGRQAQRNLGVAGMQPQRAHKAQIADRLVQLGIEHLPEPLQDRRAIVTGWELKRRIVAHGPCLPHSPDMEEGLPAT